MLFCRPESYQSFLSDKLLEIDVLRGMAQTISAHEPEMLVELHGIREYEVAKLLLSYNYRVYQIEAGIDVTRRNIERVCGHLYATRGH